MLHRVAQTIARYRMFEPAQKVGVAVSGGADSVCLLHVLLELAPRWDLRLTVLHLNHKLRAEESDRDEEFVRRLAEPLGLAVMAQSWQRSPASEGRASGNLEEAAREARLAFFMEAMASGAVDRVALGHTRSDQAETVLFRFLRGAGTAGLAGIRPVTSAGIVRPLLDVDRAEVETYLKAHGIPWREDHTNSSVRFARNRIRYNLLPQLANDWNPALGETLANTAEWALGEEAYWEAEIDRLAAGRLKTIQDAVVLCGEDLRNLPVAAARRLVRRAMERIKGDLRGIDFSHIATVLDMAASAEGHGRFQAPGVDILRSFDWLRFGRPGTLTMEHRQYRLSAPVPGTIEIPGAGGCIHLELVEKSKAADQVYNGPSDWIDWKKVSGPLELRNWRPGDRYQPVGRSGEEKVKTFFQEARIPLWERGRWPVLVDQSAIVWVRRFGLAAPYAAGSDAGVVLTVEDTGAAMGV
ncbi:MAG: tRNA lysidine(34) synthetase TilS [Bryobacteraceae bacterium]